MFFSYIEYCCGKAMAGDHGPVDDAQFKGLAKYFNSTTIRGRANVSRQIIYLCP